VATVAHVKHLHAAVTVVNGDISISVYGNAAGFLEFAWAVAAAAYCSNVCPVIVPQHLHTMVQGVAHNDVTAVIEGQTPRASKLAVSPTHSTNRAHSLTATVTKNLHAVVSPICNCNAAVSVKRHAPLRYQQLAPARTA
jgi:hypothetical protein